MLKHKSDIHRTIWRQMGFAALLLYISYFFYRWVGVFIADVIGEIADSLLYQSELALSSKLLGELTIAFVLSLLIMPAIDLVTNVMVFRCGLRFESTVIKSVISKKYETVQKWQAGEWLGRISKDSLQYRQLTVIIPTRIAADGTVLLITVITMIQINVLLAVLSLAGLILSATLQLLAKRKSGYFLEETRKYQDRKRSLQVEMVRGHSFFRMLGCEKAFPDKMRKLFGTFWSSIKKKDLRFGAGMDALQKFFVAVVFVGSLFLSLIQVQQGRMTMGDFIATYFLSMQLQTLLTSLLNNFQTMRGYEAQEDRIRELLKKEEPGGTKEISSWERLHFDQVDYIYPLTQEGMPECSFSIQRKELMRLEGKNGSGKTTLLNLLCGLFSTRNDQIKIDDVPLSSIDLVQWRKKIGYMQQFPDLFPCTVRENVRIGNLNATEAQIDIVLEKVGLNLHADRVLHGKKEDLSGGEIKRLALARLLLRLEQCELLIMDESMENLDESGKKLIKEIMDDDMRTRIVVFHHST